MSDGSSLFLYGTLRHLPLLEVVLGRAPAVRRARLPDHRARTIEGESYPAIRAEEGAEAEGLILDGVSAEERARLDFYEGAYHYALAPVTVETEAGPAAALVYFPTEAQPPSTDPWSLADWERDFGAVAVRAAREYMAQFGRVDAETARALYPMMLVRAYSAARASAEPAPAAVRGPFRGDDIEVMAEHRPYTQFFAVGEQDLRFPKFSGGMSAPVRRAAFIGGDAVTVLPYDPERDRVLLIEQFRFGPHMRGDPRPWLLEPVAGRIDPGESPEEAAKREAQEEARLTVTALHHVARYYPSPGIVAEWLVSYVGIADLPDTAAVIAGVEGEHEDIRGHVLSFDTLMELVATGEAANAPLILSAQWLSLNRDRLRGLA